MIPVGAQILPLEVKAGTAGKLRSMQVFLEEKKAPFGIRICGAKPERTVLIRTLPFYLLSQVQRLCADTG